MTTGTLELPDILDQDFAPDCEVCETNQATIALHMACGCVRLACQPCRDEMRAEMIVHARRCRKRHTHYCDACGKPVQANTWTDIVVREEPL